MKEKYIGEKVVWSKKLNKPVNQMLLRKQTITEDTQRQCIAKAKKLYPKSKRLVLTLRRNTVGRYGAVVRAFY